MAGSSLAFLELAWRQAVQAGEGGAVECRSRVTTQSGLLDRAADAALAGRTGLVIAHRLSQAAACDRIVVLEHGPITESGTHADLIAASGRYARLWSAWQDGQEPGADETG